MTMGMARRLVVTIGVLALGPGLSSPALAGESTHPPAIGDTTVFATLPYPGHPFGVALDPDRVYISTSRGDFFADPASGGFKNSDGERVFAYDRNGRLMSTTSIATMPDATMGLFGLALDGNPGPRHHLYVADMNGRILRKTLGGHPGTPELFSLPPEPFRSAGWMASMWNDLAFDRAGNLYMTDDKPRLWRVAPDGTPTIWFTDPRIGGFFGFAGGPLGGRIDPSGQYYYFSVTLSAQFPYEAVVYRLPLVDHPTAADLQVVHRFPLVAGQLPPQATGIAFAKSGNLYVALIGPNQIAVLDPSGNEIRRISSPLFDSPWGLAFMGGSLLVTNADIQPVESPGRWNVLKVFVGEEGLPLNRPRTSD